MTAVPVSHGMMPSVAYRIDTGHGSLAQVGAATLLPRMPT